MVLIFILGPKRQGRDFPSLGPLGGAVRSVVVVVVGTPGSLWLVGLGLLLLGGLSMDIPY